MLTVYVVYVLQTGSPTYGPPTLAALLFGLSGSEIRQQKHHIIYLTAKHCCFLFWIYANQQSAAMG